MMKTKKSSHRPAPPAQRPIVPASTPPPGPVSSMPTVAKVISRKFTHEKDTTNKVRFAEIVPDGQEEIIGALYMTKEACGPHRELLVTINIIGPR